MDNFEDRIGGEHNADIFCRTGSTIDMRTEAVLRAVWSAMPWNMNIQLPGGEDAVLKKFVEPRKKNGVWEFGFDVCSTTDDWHIEFFVEKTGWGGHPVGKMDTGEST